MQQLLKVLGWEHKGQGRNGLSRDETWIIKCQIVAYTEQVRNAKLGAQCSAAQFNPHNVPLI